MGQRIYLAELAAKVWPKFLRTGVFAAGTRLMSNTWLPFDSGKTYKVTAKLRRGASADGSCYVGVLLRRADGSFITGDQGGMFIVAPSGAAYTPGTSWATITRTFGSGTGRSIPADAVSMAPFFYVGHGQTVAHHDIRECWIEDTAAAGVPISADPYLLDLAQWVGVPQNYSVHTENFDNAAWTKAATTVSAGSTTDPYGGTAADKLIDTVATPASPFFYMTRSVTAGGTAGTDFTASIFAKAAELTFCNLRVDDGSTNVCTASYNLSTGAVGTVSRSGNISAISSAGAVSVGSGWYRVWLAVRFGAAPTTVSVKVRLSKGIGTGTPDLQWTGTGAQGVHFFGSQLERRLGMGPYMPIGNSVWGAITGDPTYSHLTLVGNEAVSTTLRYSTSGYVTKPTDTPANATYAGRLLQPGFLRCELPADVFGVTSMGFGELVLANGDGALSELPYFGLDGQSVTVKVGDDAAALSTFTTLFTTQMEQAVADPKSCRIRLRTLDSLLDRPLQTVTYAGNNVAPNGLEGSAEMAGQPKPLVIGTVINCAPPLVNSSRNIYQIDSSAATIDVPRVFVNGAQLAPGSAYTSQADMETNAPAAGTFRVWSGGSGTYFRIPSAATDVCYADAQNLTSNADRMLWNAVYAVATKAGVSAGDLLYGSNYTLPEPDNWPTAAGAWSTYQPQIGVWVNDTRTARQVLAELAEQAGGWVGVSYWSGVFSGSPKLGAELWPPPSSTLTANDAAASLLDASQLLDVQAVADPGPGRGVPAWRVELHDQPIRDRMTGVYASTISADIVQYRRLPYTLVYASDAAVKDKHATAQVIVKSSHAGTAVAAYHAARLLEIWRHPKLWFQVTVPLSVMLQSGRAKPRLGGYVYLRWPQLRYIKQDGTSDDEGWFNVMALEIDLSREQVRMTVRQAVEETIT